MYHILLHTVFESCVSDFEGTLLGVPHGEYAVDVANCRRCLCNDGGLVECEPSQTCQSIRLNPISCEHEGETISHGEQFDVSQISNCNMQFSIQSKVAQKVM